MGRKRTMGPEAAEAIKAAIWEGQKEVEVAQRYGMSQSSINAFKSGRMYYEAKWPDGTVGPFPEYRRDELRAVPKSTAARLHIETNPKKILLAQLIEQEENRRHEVMMAKYNEERKNRVVYTEAGKAWIAAGCPPEPRPLRPDETPIVFEKMEKLNWADVERDYPGVLCVSRAVLEDDQKLKDAICIVLKGWHPDAVHSEQLDAAVQNVMDRLVYENALEVAETVV